MSQKKFDECLEHPMEKARSVKDTLLRIFWFVVARENISIQRWGKSIYQYVNDPANVPDQDKAPAKVEARSNLRQQLVSEKLSWMYFVRSLKALGIVKAEMVLRYSFDGDNMAEVRMPIFTIKKGAANGVAKASADEASNGDNGGRG